MPYTLFIFALSFIILTPLIVLGVHGFSESSDVFIFLQKHVLPDYILNSLLLSLYTCFCAALLAIPSAWAVVRYQFLGKKIIEVMLLSPMAFPAYIVAYAYTNLFGESPIFAIRSMGGATFVLTFCLYPYIYLFARTAFLKQIKNQNQINAANLLGSGPFEQFFKIILPNARPFISVGILLVVMEVLADYGTVSYFNIKTFSTGIYNAWAGYGDSVAAAKLSLILLGFILFIIALEKKDRARMAFVGTETESVKATPALKLNLLQSSFVIIGCMIPIVFGFFIPFILLIDLMMTDFNANGITQSIGSFLPLLKNTLILAFGVSLPTVIIAYIASAIHRSHRNKISNIVYSFSGFGYALPGVVLGLGLLILSGWIGSITPFLMTGSLIFLALGYMIRFWTIPLQSIDAGFEKISPNIDHATQLMRNNRLSEFFYIRLPLLWPSMLGGFLIMSVEIIKELPLTLILRPFNYETLAINAYHLASDERLEQAALPSLVIALCGLIPVIILARLTRKA